MSPRVVRLPDGNDTWLCQGRPVGPAAAGTSAPPPPPGDGAQLGKRYVDEPTGLELLCTKPGSAVPAADGRELALKTAKPLPASD